MATTSKLLITLLEQAQSQKESTVNAGFEKIDDVFASILSYLVPTGSVSITKDDQFVAVDHSAPCTITLPSVSGSGEPIDGKTFLIFDRDGVASTHNITIAVPSGASINGTVDGTVIIAVNKGWAEIVYDGAGYRSARTLLAGGGAGSGDMEKTIYDITDNGVVDNSELLEGNDSAYHLSRANHTGTQAISSVSGLQSSLDDKLEGPASSVDNHVPRWNGTTGVLVQDSRVAISDDGEISTMIDSGSCEGIVLADHWVRLSSDYGIANSASEQKIFNATANGALTLPSGTYFFECVLYLTSMSATSGNAAFDVLGAGTATLSSILYHAIGIDSTTPLSAAAQTGSFTASQQSVASVVTAGTGTGAGTSIRGTFTVTAGGTIIPSITLVTAAAAIVKAGSFFRCRRVGADSDNFRGNWS